MLKREKVEKTETLDEMREKAMDAEDYETVKKLNDIESEMNNKMLNERLKGIFGGYGSAMAGFTVGAIIASIFKSKK